MAGIMGGFFGGDDVMELLKKIFYFEIIMLIGLLIIYCIIYQYQKNSYKTI